MDTNRVVPAVVLIACSGLLVCVFTTQGKSSNEYTVKDMQLDIQQCTYAGLKYKPLLREPVPKVGDPGGEVYGINCVLPDGGTISVNHY